MKISKSNVALAAKIKSSGFEWPQFGKWATQDRDGEIFISGGDFTPVRMSGEVNWEFDAPYKSAGKVEVGLNWFQCILSREEYFHLYPAPDAEGWIEHDGKHEPEISTSGLTIWCKWSDGLEQSHEANMVDWIDDSDVRVVAYRLHKPEKYKPEFCESVMRPSPEPDEQVWTNPPTIEQLASDYRNAKDYAERKQQGADDAKADADEKLKALEFAGEALGLKVSPIAENMASQKNPFRGDDW